jgi:hypothetical protein
LYLTIDDVDEAVDRLVQLMERGDWQAPEHAVRNTVT